MRELIITKADLLIETDMPKCLSDLCAHVASYQAILKKWEDNDFSEHFAIIAYPRKPLLNYTEEKFKSLKEKQKKLIGEITKEEH